jgi:hypothetical protein
MKVEAAGFGRRTKGDAGRSRFLDKLGMTREMESE